MQSKEQESVNDSKFPLPFFTSVDIMNRIINEMKGSKKAFEIAEIYRGIKANNVYKTYGLKLARFFTFVTSDSRKAMLTDLGYRYSIANDVQRKEILTQHLPSEYITFLKWMRDTKNRSLTIDDLKQEIIKNYTWKPNARSLHEALLTFNSITESCGLTTFTKGSRGAASRFTITDKGLEVLGIVPSTSVSSSPINLQDYLPLQEEKRRYTYPVFIKTPDMDFKIDIKHESDWGALDGLLNAMKTKWKREFHEHADSKKSNKQSAENDKLL